MLANQFKQPIDYYGTYGTNTWAGYVFKETLGYTSGKHTGVDYNGAGAGNADLGMEIYSIANGIVRWVGNRSDIGFGNTTIVEHPLSPTLKTELGCDSLFARYMHQNTIDVSAGQEVKIGQKIGTVGNSGTQWAHLHLDLYKSTIEGSGVHFRYDKNTQLLSYLDVYTFIQGHLNAVDTAISTAGYQRQVSNLEGVNGRSQPTTKSNIVKEFTHGEILDFKGYVHGEDPIGRGNDIWFVGKHSNTYWYSGAFSDTGTHDLADLTPKPTAPEPTPESPKPETKYQFEKDVDCVTEVIPASIGNFEYGNFPLSPLKLVIHDFGKHGLDTYQSTINEFTKKGTEKSAHFVVSGKKITQMVSLKDRAYHARSAGNVYIGIETDPTQDPDTLASARLLIRELEQKYGYKFEFIEHNQLEATECGDDVNLENYREAVTPPVASSGDLTGKQILEQLKALNEHFERVFK